MKAVVLGMIAFYNIVPMIMTCAMLAGAGIDTQPTFQASKGLHGSTLFTVSLPVSRFRLLAVRAAVGWLESVATIALFCWGSWFMSPVLRVVATSAEMAEYAVTLIACGSALYFLSVLLATFLDDQWRTWGTMFAAGALWWISHKDWLPASVDIVQAIGKNSPLIAHTMPWSSPSSSPQSSSSPPSKSSKPANTNEPSIRVRQQPRLISRVAPAIW
jgi:hypothetical protein